MTPIFHWAQSYFHSLLANQIAVLLEDKRALERLTKSKESALLEAERILRSALERALIVDEVQNQNFELRRQIEICQASLSSTLFCIWLLKRDSRTLANQNVPYAGGEQDP